MLGHGKLWTQVHHTKRQTGVGSQTQDFIVGCGRGDPGVQVVCLNLAKVSAHGESVGRQKQGKSLISSEQSNKQHIYRQQYVLSANTCQAIPREDLAQNE